MLGAESIMSEYESGPAIADLLVSASGEIEKGAMTEATLNRLWGIFAPTCDWDDVIGDVELGHEIFEILGEVRRTREGTLGAG